VTGVQACRGWMPGAPSYVARICTRCTAAAKPVLRARSCRAAFQALLPFLHFAGNGFDVRRRCDRAQRPQRGEFCVRGRLRGFGSPHCDRGDIAQFKWIERRGRRLRVLDVPRIVDRTTSSAPPRLDLPMLMWIVLDGTQTLRRRQSLGDSFCDRFTMLRIQRSGRLELFPERVGPPDPNATDVERPSEERPLRGDKAQRGVGLEVELLDQCCPIAVRIASTCFAIPPASLVQSRRPTYNLKSVENQPPLSMRCTFPA